MKKFSKYHANIVEYIHKFKLTFDQENDKEITILNIFIKSYFQNVVNTKNEMYYLKVCKINKLFRIIFYIHSLSVYCMT